LKQILKYILLTLLSLGWVVSCVPILRKMVSQTGIIPDDYRYGDLYRLSNLAQFREKVSNERPKSSPKQSPKHNHQALYLIGDSFTEANWINKDDFAVEKFVHVPWYKTQAIHLDTAQYNVLILESVERHSREHFGKPIQNIRLDEYKTPETSLMTDLEKALGSAEETIESLWLSSDLFLWFKESKAKLNYTLFDRNSDKVSVSKNKQHLLFRLDTDTTLINSCFSKLPNSEVDSMVQAINEASDYYKKQGFDAVYLSVIPNKTSIVAANDGVYNHLIERIENHPKLTVPTISVWTDYNNKSSEVYLKGDSHWNSTGRDVWVIKAKELINQ
jgi:hypothetical protein